MRGTKPNAGDQIRAAATPAASPKSTASPCPVTCWRCGADCVYREHFYRDPHSPAGGALSKWQEACCSRCSWTDRPLDTYEGERHPEG